MSVGIDSDFEGRLGDHERQHLGFPGSADARRHRRAHVFGGAELACLRLATDQASASLMSFEAAALSGQNPATHAR